MEDYLREIVSEYEKNFPILDSAESIRFSQLNRLDVFTGKTHRESKSTDDNCFESNFSDPYDKVIKLISQHLI